MIRKIKKRGINYENESGKKMDIKDNTGDSFF